VATRLSAKRGSLSLDAYLSGGATLINETTLDQDGFPVPPGDYLESSSQIVLVEIPVDFQAIKKHNMALAQSWRIHGRRLFEDYFQKGYLATDFVRHKDDEGRARSFYSLTLSDTRPRAGNK
jgi:predicted GNAT superfamily acetyltransferase